MPSILKSQARLKYFNKHGFTNIRLTIYIMDIESNFDQIVALEQHFIDTLKPNLNVDLVASSSGYHEPMLLEIREKLRLARGNPVYIYEANTVTLLYIFGSRQHMYSSINIHNKTLNDCLAAGTLYLNYFFLSLEPLESTSTNLVTLDEIKEFVTRRRDLYKIVQPASKAIIAQFRDVNLEFDSLNSLAKYLKGDRQVIRDYLKGQKSGYYRGK